MIFVDDDKKRKPGEKGRRLCENGKQWYKNIQNKIIRTSDGRGGGRGKGM